MDCSEFQIPLRPLENSTLSSNYFMESSHKCVETEEFHTVGAEGAIRNWVRQQGRSKATSEKVVALLQRQCLLAEPRPKMWNRKGKFADAEHCRYLWYRHTAKLLGWKERRHFPEFVTSLLKNHFFTSPLDVPSKVFHAVHERLNLSRF